MSILGTRVVRTEDPRLLTVGGTYVDDLRVPELERAVQVTFVRRPVSSPGRGRGGRGPDQPGSRRPARAGERRGRGTGTSRLRAGGRGERRGRPGAAGRAVHPTPPRPPPGPLPG